MQVIVQNGAQHGLARRSVEAMAPLFPASWSREVKSIVLVGGNDLHASFYPKERSLALSWPRKPPFPSRADAIETLVAALAAVSELGALPKRFSPSSYVAKSASVAAVLGKCIQVASGAA